MPAAASANVARHLPAMAAAQPQALAIRVPRGPARGGTIDYLALTFAELDREVDAWAHRLRGAGLRQGDRVLVMVRPGLPLIAAVFALFKLGAPPVVVDPGMGRAAFLECVRRTRPVALLGIPAALAASWIFRSAFRSVRRRVWVSPRLIARRARGEVPPFPIAPTGPRDLAAVLFTSGSTGAPKGVLYEHGQFEAQVESIRATFGIAPGGVDLPLLPIFALFNPALGVTTVVPRLDPARPATIDPVHVVQAIRQNGVTHSFGSPVLWSIVARHCLAHGVTLPSVQRLFLAGAPVPPALFADLRRVCPGATLWSPYGATEALPVSAITAAEVLGDDAGDPGTAAATARGAGTCVGRTVAGMDARVIAIHSGPIPSWAAARELPAGEIGEIVVRGPVVTRAYDALPDATAAAKIPDGDAVWHRMGDAGWRDADGRLWFCGRVAERVATARGVLFPDQVEPIFNAHPRARRTALLGFGEPGRQVAALAVEPWPGREPRDSADKRAFARELRTLGAAHAHTADIRVFYFVERFPVDVRHNAKIHRLRLARDLAGQPGLELDLR